MIGPYTDFIDELENGIESVLLGGVDPETALATAQQNVTTSLERYAQD